MFNAFENRPFYQSLVTALIPLYRQCEFDRQLFNLFEVETCNIKKSWTQYIVLLYNIFKKLQNQRIIDSVKLIINSSFLGC